MNLTTYDNTEQQKPIISVKKRKGTIGTTIGDILELPQLNIQPAFQEPTTTENVTYTEPTTTKTPFFDPSDIDKTKEIKEPEIQKKEKMNCYVTQEYIDLTYAKVAYLKKQGIEIKTSELHKMIYGVINYNRKENKKEEYIKKKIEEITTQSQTQDEGTLRNKIKEIIIEEATMFKDGGNKIKDISDITVKRAQGLGDSDLRTHNKQIDRDKLTTEVKAEIEKEMPNHKILKKKKRGNRYI